jgi:hypothetical protein
LVRAALALLLLISVVFSAVSYAEEGTNEGMIAEVLTETDLFSEPDELSPSQGRLPEGSLLRLLGKRKGSYENVEVELTDGIAEGWVRRKMLNLKVQEQQQENWEKKERRKGVSEGDDTKRKPRRSDKMYIPEDEELLLKRHTSFFYGLVFEVPVAYIQDNLGNLFTGPNYRLGAHVGFYLTKSMPMRFEVAYARMAGTSDPASPVGVDQSFEVGFADLRSQLEYELGDFSLLGYLQYSFGTGVNAAPATTAALFSQAASLSSLWVGGGAGYRVRFGESNRLMMQLTYGMSLKTDPVGFQAVGIRFLWEIRG